LIAPAFSGSQRIMGHPEYSVKTLLHGLTGKLEDKEYEGVMIAMDMNDDEYIASVISYIRNEFGNEGSFVTPEYVAQIREETKDRDSNYSFEELIQEVPKALPPQDNWITTASSTALQGVGSTKDPSYAFGFKGWKTEDPQESRMWFQVELPDSHNLAEIQFDSGKDEFPITYTVSTSPNGSNWTEVVKEVGHAGVNNARWKSDETVRFIKIESSEKGEKPWAMRNLIIYSR